MYLCVRGIARTSERSCICVLGVSIFLLSVGYSNFSDNVIFYLFFSFYNQHFFYFNFDV